MISRIHISAILLIVAVTWGICLILSGVPVTASLFRPFSIVAGVLVITLSIANNWLWRLRWLRPWLFKMPDLNGTWRVVLRPTAPDRTRGELRAFMVIRQTFSTISLRLLTPESASETLAARVVLEEDGMCSVASLYRNTPRLRVRDRSELHHGAMLLNVHGVPPESLAGQYWTDRLSEGEIELFGRSPGLAYSFDEATRLASGQEGHVQ